MPKCLDCGNQETFRVAYISWKKLYFNPGKDYSYDSKSLVKCLSDEPPTCDECGSSSIEGALND